MATKKVKIHHASLPILPQDLVIGILSRLPAKSLVRFKCVCKSWLNLFIQPHFVKMHLSQSKERRLIFSRGSWDLNFRREPLIQSNDNDLRTMHIVPPFTEEPQVWIFGSCNGLLLLQTHACDTLYVVNISTRKLNRILGMPFWFRKMVSYGFGYDASSDDYIVVAISSPRASLYKLKTNSWGRIQDFPLEWTPSEPGLLLNGVLHWFSCQVSRMICFDLVEEKFREVPLPVDLQSQQCEGYPFGVCESYAIGVVGGCLCIGITGLCMPSVEFWVMKEYGKRESWTNLGEIMIPYNFYAKSLDFSNNDENLFLIDESRLLVYNLKEKTCRYPEIFNMFHKWFGAETYLESIVSPKYHNVV